MPENPPDKTDETSSKPEMPSENGPLSAYGGGKPTAPDWFEKAIATPYQTHFIQSGDTQLHVQSWGTPDKPGLLLTHGNGAHAHWWDFIAPYFAAHYHIVAMTFAGMGDSAWRSGYALEAFSEDQIRTCQALGLFEHAQKPIIVAHSFGAFVTLNTGAKYGTRFGGVVLVDSPVNPPDRPSGGPPRKARPNKIYPSLGAALARFRLAPPQPCENHYAMDYIARHSLKQITDETGKTGWVWKFDPMIWQRFHMEGQPAEMLKSMACRLAIIRGEESALMPEEVGRYMQTLLGHQVPYVSIPHAHHHVMLDQPLAFISALRMLLAEWSHSDPHRQI